MTLKLASPASLLPLAGVSELPGYTYDLLRDQNALYKRKQTSSHITAPSEAPQNTPMLPSGEVRWGETGSEGTLLGPSLLTSVGDQEQMKPSLGWTCLCHLARGSQNSAVRAHCVSATVLCT
jgi:hypothetical protein